MCVERKEEKTVTRHTQKSLGDYKDGMLKRRPAIKCQEPTHPIAPCFGKETLPPPPLLDVSTLHGTPERERVCERESACHQGCL